MDARPVPPAGALLLRIEVAAINDLSALPRVPAPHSVSVSVSDAHVRSRLDDDNLATLGYRVVGMHQARPGGPSVEALLLLRSPLLDAHPTWARELMRRADRAYDGDLGPVQAVFASVFQRHLAD